MSVQVERRTPVTDQNQSPSREINIYQAISDPFDPGSEENNVGKPEKISISPLDRLKANRHFIKGDGSCWSRALWQCVFSQILDDETEFSRFVNKVASPNEGYDIPELLAKNVIHILYKLRCLDSSGRIAYLNHSKVDDSLVFFMRHVSGEFMKKNFSVYSDEDIHEIKTNKSRYGGAEINAFARYFGIATHTISRNAERQWTYQYYGKNGEHACHLIEDIAKDSFNMPRICLFGANDAHFEAVSFDNPEIKPELFSKPLIRSLNTLEQQILEDYELAVKLHEEINASCLQVKQDEVFAKSLQKKLLDATSASGSDQVDDTHVPKVEDSTNDKEVPKPTEKNTKRKETHISNKTRVSWWQSTCKAFVSFFSWIWHSFLGLFKRK